MQGEFARIVDGNSGKSLTAHCCLNPELLRNWAVSLNTKYRQGTSRMLKEKK